MKRKLLFLITIVLFALVVTSCGCGGSGGGSGGGGGKEPEKKTLEAITLVVDKTTIEFGESINLSFTTTPDKPETHNDKAYDPLCVEYYVTVDGVTTLVSNRSETATYTPSVCGVITLYAKYCNHKMHSGSENDVVSQTVSVTVRGKSIATAEDLEKLSGSSDAFELSNDIDLGGIEWTPISFSGTLDGKGFSIRNFKITENIDRAGFFSTLSGTVRDLDISDAEILVRGSKTYAGLLAAELKGTVVNVTVNGVVNAK